MTAKSISAPPVAPPGNENPIRVRTGRRSDRNPVPALLLGLLWAALLAWPAAEASAGVVLTNLYSFTGGNDGAGPNSDLVQGSAGDFYGMTYVGGTNGLGTVFKISATGTFTCLHSFTGGNDGAYPEGPLVRGDDGYLYGTTDSGGTNNSGNVFKISATGTFTSLYSFTGGNDGAGAESGLVQGSDGYFYGTTEGGGTNGAGTVFKVSATGAFTSLYSFSGGDDGDYPNNTLVQGSDGYFYGTTLAGGTNDDGELFKISATGTFTGLHSFAGDGGSPYGALTQGSDGYFYGVTQFGGPSDAGTVFKASATGAVTNLYYFTGGNDGGNPYAALAQGNDGYFYGTTLEGGTSGAGTVFRISATGAFTSLYSLTGGTDGKAPEGRLLQGSDGNFYGTTTAGATNNAGTVFRLTVPTALAFNGFGQYVSVPGFGAIAPTNEVTIEFWAYINQAASQAAFMLSPIPVTDRLDGHIDFFDGTTYWDCGDTTTSGRLTLPNPPGSITNWMHYALVADRHGNAMYLYTNGVLAACKVGMTPFARGTNELGIGGDSGYYLNGKLDEFRVWTVARSQAQILASMNAPLTGNEPGLLLYYKFDETSGNIASNSASATGPAYNGTLINGPTRVAGTPFTTFVPTYVVTTMADSGPGSLRQAILNAAANPGPDIIGFAAALNGGTIQLNSQISVADTNGVTIDATTLPGGLTVQGKSDQGLAGNFGLFINASGSTVNFRGLVLAKGGGSGFTNSTGFGGAINNSGTLTLTRCSLSGNIAYNGGAIYNDHSLTMAQCTLAGNRAFFQGGAIYTVPLGTDSLMQCTLAGNSAGNAGGAIEANQGTETLTQCTLAGNSGGFFSGAIDAFGTETLAQCTLAGNSAEYAGAIWDNALLTLNNTIVAGNHSRNFGGADIITAFRTITFAGANIVQFISDAHAGPTNYPAAISANPRLAPLGNYGGLTQTMPPLPGSPAIDAGAPTSLTADQRGFALPQDSTGTGIPVADIGAVEGVYNPAGPGVPTGLGPYPSWAPVVQQRLEFTQFTNGSTAYTVFATTNLAIPFNAWSNLGTNVVEAPPGSGEYLFTDVNATNVPARFYRVKSF